MIGMQGDANVILRNAINVNQGLQMIDYADALHVGNRACMLMHVARCKHVRVHDQRSRCVYHSAFIWLFRILIA